jgi:alpha-tubulin suppressor-like RCC1 family protein
MAKVARYCMSIFLLTLLLRPGASFGQNLPDGGQFRDMRIFLEFVPGPGYYAHPEEQEKMRRGVELGLRMWQSVLPGITYRWVYSPEEANFTITFGDYTTSSPFNLTSECPAGKFTGCAVGSHIWMNDGGKLDFVFEEVDNISRDDIYRGYVPATFPPRNYQYPAVGDVNGTYPFIPHNDISMIMLHEYAHCLGMGHYSPNLAEMVDWFGTSNLFSPNPSQYPGLPAHYYGCGTPSSPCPSTLKPLHLLALNHVLGTEFLPGKAVPDGMILPPYAFYNSRVFFEKDYSQTGPYKYTRKTAGLVYMYKPSTYERYITGDWDDALAKSQLQIQTQSNPYFVMDVRPTVEARSKLASGLYHTLAIRDDGSLWTWGGNGNGQLGLGNVISSTKPMRVGSATDWLAVAAGDRFSVALKTDGTLWAWGNNAFGNLGIGSFGGTRTAPALVCNVSGQPCYGNKYVAVSAGAGHVLALRNDGTIWAFGLNVDGQAGDGSNANRAYPTLSGGGSNSWVSIAAGGYHSLAINAYGYLFGWGLGSSGQLGTGSTSSSTSPSQEATYAGDWSEILAGGTFSFARKTDGTLYGWGSNGDGQLGNGTTSDHLAYPTPLVGEGGNNDWTDLAAGQWHAGGVKNHGEIVTWGFNGAGQLGDNTNIGRSIASSGPNLGMPEWTSIAMGQGNTLAYKRDGTLWAWGQNDSGQLGNGGKTRYPEPEPTLFGKVPTIAINYLQFSYIRLGDTIPLRTTVSGNVKTVELLDGTTRIGSVLTGPRSDDGYWGVDWVPTTRGTHTVYAKVTDQLGTVVSAQIEVYVSILGGWQISPLTAGTKVNLSPTGVVDWMHMGRSGNEINRKLGTNVLRSYVPSSWTASSRWAGSASNSLGFYWSGGKNTFPLVGTVVIGSPTYNGFQLTSTDNMMEAYIPVAAENAKRTLKLYVRAVSVDIQMQGVLNYVDSKKTWTDANGLAVLSIDYAPGKLPADLQATLQVTKRNSGAQFEVLAATITPAP